MANRVSDASSGFPAKLLRGRNSLGTLWTAGARVINGQFMAIQTSLDAARESVLSRSVDDSPTRVIHPCLGQTSVQAS